MAYSEANHLTKLLRVAYQIENFHNGDRFFFLNKYFKACSNGHVLDQRMHCCTCMPLKYAGCFCAIKPNLDFNPGTSCNCNTI